jgi:hypothetical protein
VEDAKGPILEGPGLGFSSANYECFRLGGNSLQKISTDGEKLWLPVAGLTLPMRSNHGVVT